MQGEDVNLNKWKEVAQEVMGTDFFGDFFSGSDTSGPRHNLYKSASEIIVLVELPYIRDLSQIKLNVRQQELTVKGKIELGFDHLQSVETQIFSGHFEKSISLPQTVHTKKVNAQYKQGLLIIQLFPRLHKDHDSIPIER